MRIAIAGIANESCTFSPCPTRKEDFFVLRGRALLDRHPYLSRFEGVEFVPILRAAALPGGSVEPAAYRGFKEEILNGLHGSKWDGVYLDIHGALHVTGMEDAESDLVGAVREAVGPGSLIGASYDLHGNLSPRLMELYDLMTAFRTAPHLDGPETRERAVTMMVDCLKRGVHPHMTYVPVPITLPGERATTDDEPAKSVYGMIPEVIGNGVTDASILVGYTWADEPRSGASVVALGPDAEAVRDAAHRIAKAFWNARHDFRFGLPTGSIDECIRRALDAPESCVFISDAGDNVTGGGAGDVPLVLERLLAHKVPSALCAGIADADAVRACAGRDEVELSLGGKLDPIHGRPLKVRARVLGTLDGEAVIQVDNVKVILTERRTAFTQLKQFERHGLDPLAHRIVSVKLGYLFPDLKKIAPLALLAFSPGAINANIEELPYQRIRRPIYPLDPEMTWE